MYPNELRYTREHEWVRVEGRIATVGITHYAQEELGDVVYVELPVAGEALAAGAEFGTVESVKAVSPLFAPISGEVVEVNEALIAGPENINEGPYEAGWMIKVSVVDENELDELMAAEAYEQFVDDLHA
jgi:glycine cleavage system H protein